MSHIRLNKILVYCEPRESPAAIPLLLPSPTMEVRIVVPVEPLPATLRFATSAPLDQWRAAHVARIESELAAAVSELAGRGFAPDRITARVITGDILEVVRVAIRENSDLLCKTLGDPVLDFKLLRNSPCPVWLSRLDAPPRRIAVAVAPVSPLATPAEAEETERFNRLLADWGLFMAERFDASLHLVQAAEMPFASFIRSQDSLSEDYLARSVDEVRQRFIAFAKETKVEGISRELHFEQGDPEEMIPRIVAREDIDLLVIGTVARTGVAGHLIGNIAEHVLNRVACCVLAVKPEGWVSSVTP